MTSEATPHATVAALGDVDLQTEVLFDVLSSTRRQFVVACLAEYGSPMALADVADELVTWERDAPITDIPAEEVKSAYVSLYHVHVPKLEEAALLEYSQEPDTVAASEAGRELATHVPLPTVGRSTSAEDRHVE